MNEVTVKLLVNDASCPRAVEPQYIGQECWRPTPTFGCQSVEDTRTVFKR